MKISTEISVLLIFLKEKPDYSGCISLLFSQFIKLLYCREIVARRAMLFFLESKRPVERFNWPHINDDRSRHYSRRDARYTTGATDLAAVRRDVILSKRVIRGGILLNRDIFVTQASTAAFTRRSCVHAPRGTAATSKCNYSTVNRQSAARRA